MCVSKEARIQYLKNNTAAISWESDIRSRFQVFYKKAMTKIS